MKLHLYILRELIVGFAFTLGGVLVLTLPAITAVTVHKLAGVPVSAMLLYIPLVQAGLIPYVLPLSFLLSVVSTYGRLAADNEWTAIRMSGRNPVECLLPGLVMSVALGLLTLWLLSNKLPEIRLRENAYKSEVVAQAFRNISPGRTEFHLEEFYVSAASREGDDFIDAFVHVPASKRGWATRRPAEGEPDVDGRAATDGAVPEPARPAQTILAERVRFTTDEDNIYAHLINARSFVDGQDLRLGYMEVRFDLELLRGQRSPSSKTRYMKSGEMREELRDPDIDPKRAAILRYDIHQRRALASTCLMFLLLGAPTALLLRRGTQLLATAVAVGYVLLYYLLSMRAGKLLAQAQVVSPEVAAWSVVAVGTLAGVVLTWRALRE